MFLHDPLYSCTILEYLTTSFVLSSRNMLLLHGVVFDLYILTLHMASLFVASARSGRIVPKNSRIAPVIRNGRRTRGGYYRCWPYDRLFVACHVMKTSLPFIKGREEYCGSFAADASSTVQ